MATEPLSLLPALPAAEPLVAFRWSTYDVPFWALPNTRPGRWNLANGEPAQYWSLSPQAAWAELIRLEELTTREELDEVRMPLWVCRVAITRLIDLRQPMECERFGLAPDALIADDWDACHRALPALRTYGAGVLGPCAALPAETNLTLFGPRRAISWSAVPALASAVPTAKASIGRPPDGLVDRVRRRTRGPFGDRLCWPQQENRAAARIEARWFSHPTRGVSP